MMHTHSRILIRHLLFLTAIFIPALIQAQNPDNDVVTLKNGTYLRGRVLELIPEKSLKIRLGTGDTLEIRMDSVKSLTKDDSSLTVKMNTHKDVRKWGYVFTPQLFAGVGQSQEGGPPRVGSMKQGEYFVMLSVVNGLRLGPFCEIGVGVGLDIWDERMFIPLYFDIRVNFLKKNNTPFVYINSGYSWGWINTKTAVDMGGVLASGGIGARFMISQKQRMFFALGYKFQQFKSKRFPGTTDFNAHFFSLGAGVEF